MSPMLNVSRRAFIQGMFSTGALVLCASMAPETLFAQNNADLKGAADPMFRPNVFVAIETDGTVRIVAHRSEMGTGIRTSLPIVLADELDADWRRVKIDQAISDPRYGSQDTDGSHSIRSFFDTMRECGATARLMLLRAAAQQWNVPPQECEASLHAIVHRATGRKLGYGQLAAVASKLPVPDRSEIEFKPARQWRYIGKWIQGYDVRDICTGKPIFGMDARVDGMLFASIERPPVLGGKVKSLDDKEALSVSGVRQTVPIPPFTPPCAFQPLGGVAVIADNTWAAFQGRQKLKIDWDNGPNADYDSDKYKAELRETSRKPGKPARIAGDVEAEFAKGGKIIEAEYYVPLLAHASMEPPVALAEVRGDKVTVWAPTQNPQEVQEAIAGEMGIASENVTCYVTLLGGGFGRKSKPDYAVEAALLSKATGRPVKLVWTREDDIRFGYYNSVAAMYMKAAIGSNGLPTAWLQRSTFPPIASTFDEDAVYGGAGALGQGWTDIPFNIANLRVENGPAKAHVRIGWLRSVANIYHAFGVQTFADELAHHAGRDPLEYMLDLIGPPRTIDLSGYGNYGASPEQYPIDAGRLRRVLEIAAEKSGWGKRKPGAGTGWGLAVHRSFVTYVASVVQVEVNDKGEIKIPRVDTVVDAGMIVNPQFVKAQFEGAAVFGTSIARTGEITASDGAVDQSNFHDYPVARIAEAPYETNVYIVESTAPPGGVGEPGVPPFVPALCNAVYAATGIRVRDLPLAKTNLAKQTAKAA
ncbi:MAG: molybdopterin cofactor-binding domain-containing protein [Candidatus Binataceae bacterium]